MDCGQSGAGGRHVRDQARECDGPGASQQHHHRQRQSERLPGHLPEVCLSRFCAQRAWQSRGRERPRRAGDGRHGHKRPDLDHAQQRKRNSRTRLSARWRTDARRFDAIREARRRRQGSRRRHNPEWRQPDCGWDRRPGDFHQPERHIGRGGDRRFLPIDFCVEHRLRSSTGWELGRDFHHR